MKTRHGIVAVTCTALPLATAAAAAAGAVTRGARGNENAESTTTSSDLFEKYRYTPNQIDPQIAAGGLDKMIENGVFKKNDGNQQRRKQQLDEKEKKKLGSSKKTESRRKLQLRSGIPETTEGTDTKRVYDSYEGAAWSPVYDDDDGWYYDDTVQDDGVYYDDSLGAEEVLYLSAFQDLRSSSSEPIYVTPEDPDPLSTGNLWVYTNVPIQEPAGIGVSALLGQVHGTCQSTFQNLNGFCSFTYEFFDGGPEVVASMTVEGATEPFGASILTVSGGDGELAGVSGEVQLYPVTLDDTFVPPLLTEDDTTLFLGNPVGYMMEAVVYVRFRVADVVDDYYLDDQYWDDDIVLDTEAAAASAEEPDVDFVVVQCAGESSFCDCDMNCVDGSTFCDCMEGVACCQDPDE